MTYQGLSVFDPQSGKLSHVSQETQIALSGLPWSTDNMLFSGNGLYETQGDMDKGFKLVWHDVVTDTVQYYPLWLDRKGRIWLNEYPKQLIILDTSDFQIIKTIENQGRTIQMAESNDGSTIWSISNTGYGEIDSDSLYIRKIHNENNGFPSGGFNSLIVDLENHIWLTRNEGIMKYDPENGTIRSYTQADGLSPLEYTGASYRFDDGEIWLGANNGITRFYPDSIHDLQITAFPQITEILVNDHIPTEKLVCIQTGAINIPLIRELSFNYEHNTLAFRVNALEYSSPQYNKVKYQMEGMDAELIENFFRKPGPISQYGVWQLSLCPIRIEF